MRNLGPWVEASRLRSQMIEYARTDNVCYRTKLNSAWVVLRWRSKFFLRFDKVTKICEKRICGLGSPWDLSWACQDHDVVRLKMYDCMIVTPNMCIFNPKHDSSIVVQPSCFIPYALSHPWSALAHMRCEANEAQTSSWTQLAHFIGMHQVWT